MYVWEQAKFKMIHAMKNLTDFTSLLCSSVFILQLWVLWDKGSIYIVYNWEAYQEKEGDGELLRQTLAISPPSNPQNHFQFLFMKNSQLSAAKNAGKSWVTSYLEKKKSC